MRVGVFGGASAWDERSKSLAEKTGRALARAQATIVTGATTGLPHFAAQAALAEGGFVIGISPAASIEEHVNRYQKPIDGCSEIFFTGVGIAGRNHMNSHNSDAAIVVGGEVGTLQEFCVAFAEGKVIGILEGSGGVTKVIPEILKHFTKDCGARILYNDDPEMLVRDVIAAFRGQAS